MTLGIGPIIEDILAREGGYVDRAADRGGPTRWGITLATLSEWRHSPQTADDVRLLPEDEAKAIYRDRYIVQPGFADLKDPLRALLVDSAVQHGPSRAVRWLQRAVGVADDGRMGGLTVGALARADAGGVYRKVLADRVRFYGRLITDTPSEAEFAAGWANRVAQFIELAA